MGYKPLDDSELYESVYQYKSRRATRKFVLCVLIVLFVALSFRAWWTDNFGGVIVDGPSMERTLQTEDRLLMRFGNDAKRGDVIVVDVSKYGFKDRYGNRIGFLIKRLIAIEGDEVYCKDGVTYIRYKGTTEFVVEPYSEKYAYVSENYNFGLYEVGENEIFFLGDNRCNSTDSRYRENLSHFKDRLYTRDDIYGVVPEWSVKYRSYIRYLPCFWDLSELFGSCKA